MSLWVDKYYKVKGEYIDALRCYIALLIEELNEQNYGNVKNHAIRINNVIGEIFEKLEEEKMRRIKLIKNALIIEIEDAEPSHPLAYYTNVVHYVKDGKIVRIEIKYEEEGKLIEMVKKSFTEGEK